MTTDRELLENAAKAAGYWNTDFNCYDGAIAWNPLTDDGDAFRLAIKCLPFHTLKYSREDYDHCQQDPYAATRRAIVRAVAAIGAKQ